MLSGKNLDHKTVEGFSKILKEHSSTSSEEHAFLGRVLKNALIEVTAELDREDYQIISDLDEEAGRKISDFSIRIHKFLLNKEITPLNSLYFFYQIFIHIHNKFILPSMQLFTLLFKIFKEYQKSASLYMLQNNAGAFIMFNGPNFEIGKKYLLSQFEAEAKHLKNVIVLTDNFEIYPSLEYFIKIHSANPNLFHLNHTFTVKSIKSLTKHRTKIFSQAKDFLDELRMQMELERKRAPFLQLPKNIKLGFDEKNIVISPEKKLITDAQLLSQEIREYDKFSPIERHKNLIALQKDLRSMTLNNVIQNNIQNHETLVNNYIKKSTELLHKNELLDTVESPHKYNIEEFKTLYSILITNDNIVEKQAVFKELQNIKNEYDSLFSQSLKQLETSICDAQQLLKSEFKTTQDKFYSLHRDFLDKLNILKTLHKEAEIKQSKKLKQVTIFTKNQSVAKYLGQISHFKKIVDKSSDTDVSKIKTFILTLEKDFKAIDDKTQTLHKILQSSKRRKTAPKTITLLKKDRQQGGLRRDNFCMESELHAKNTPLNASHYSGGLQPQGNFEDKKFDATTEISIPSKDNVVEDLEDEKDMPNFQNKNKKQRKKERKNKSRRASEKSLTTTSITSMLKKEVTTDSAPLAITEPVIVGSEAAITHTQLETKTIIDSFSMRKALAALQEIDPPIIPGIPESTSLLQHLSMFKSNMVISPSELKTTPVDFKPYSYGLLIRCKNNSSLNPFAQRITRKIQTFSPNRELSSQPHISLFYVEDLQLNNATMREKINIDLQELFSKMPLPSTLHLISVGAYGVGHNDNKFLALEIKTNEQLNNVYEACLGVFKKHGISIQKKYDFKPHITLGYSKVALCQSQLNSINPEITKSYVELDVAVFNRKPPPKKGVPNNQIKLEELQTFKLILKEEDSQLRMKA